MNTQEVQGWKNQSGFIWAVLGSVVGFANVLSFSAQCYRNGGGAFLIPYFFAYLLLGLPMLLLEGMVGQKFASPLITAIGRHWKAKGKIFSWIAIGACFTIGSFYIVLTAYSLLYMGYSVGGVIPADTTAFFKEQFLQATHSLGDWGTFRFPIFGAVLLIVGFVFFTMARHISQGVETVCSMIMPILTLFVMIFAIAACLLPGGMDGVWRFIRPDLERLKDLSLWRDVFGQLFFSLSLGLGIITGYSQYNGTKVSLRKSMTLVAIGDFVISFIAGVVVFACIGYMSTRSAISFEQIIQTDSAFEIGFIIFPKILQTLTPWLQPIIGGLFFFCVFIAGITGVFSIIESVCGNIERELDISRIQAVSYTLIATTVFAAIFCMGNGQLIIGSLAPMVLGIAMISSALFEIITFLYRSPEIMHDPIWEKNGKKRVSFYTLKYLVPLILVVILAASIQVELSKLDMGLFIRMGWLLVALLMGNLLTKAAAARKAFNLT